MLLPDDTVAASSVSGGEVGFVRARRRVTIMVAAGLVYALALMIAAVRSPDRGFFTFQGGQVLRSVDSASQGPLNPWVFGGQFAK